MAMIYLVGCASAQTPFVPAADRGEGLPEDLDGLLALADQLQSDRGATLADLDRSLAAIEAAQGRGLGAPFQLHWREARGASLLGRALSDAQQRQTLIARALKAGRLAVEAEPKRVEGHYFLAVALAFDAENSQELERIAPLVEQAERALSLGEAYDQAGPLRLLGKIYLEAPEWPTSIGDKERAVELLARAVEVSPTAMNHYFLGEALYHDEQLSESYASFAAALAMTGSARLEKPWRALAEEYLEEIGLAGYRGGAR